MTRRKPKPNDRIQRTAAKLLGIANEVTDVVETMRDELASLGFAGGSSGEGRGSGTSAPVERDAVRIHELTANREDLRDLITDVSERADALVRFVKHLSGTPLPGADGEALCSDKQMGREGAIDWGDATCTELPLQGGLCFRCYQRERRWRRARGLEDRSEPAA